MRIIAKLVYGLIFIVLAVAAMFVGGVSGVAGTFYLMVEPGNINDNLTVVITALSALWLLVIMLRQYNKKVLKRNHMRAQQATEKEA